jgi:hypothetical protein
MWQIILALLALLASTALIGLLAFGLDRLQQKASNAVVALRKLDDYLSSHPSASTTQHQQKADR